MSVVFERFTDQARRAVVLAQEEARLLNHNFIGTEHVLLGLLQVDDTGQRLLDGLGLDFEATRARIEERTEPRPESPGGHIPFTPDAKKALELSLREALQLGDHFIGTEHLLLGLLREGEGLAAKILRESGADLEALRRAVSQMGSETGRGEFDPEEREMIEIPAEHFVRLVGEVARLRDLLRHHGIDPGEELPELGPEGEPPVA